MAMNKDKWRTYAYNCISFGTAKEADQLVKDCPLRFDTPPVSTANWDGFSWLKWILKVGE